MTEILQRAVSAHQAGDLVQAERLYRKVIAKSQKSFHAKHLLGVLRLQLGDAKEADRLIHQAIVLNPDDDEAHYHRGMVQVELQQFDMALASFDRSIEINPTKAEAYSNRGVTLQHLQRHRQAIGDFDRAIAIAPNVPDAHYNRGNALLEIGAPDEALASYDRAIALQPNNPLAHFNRGHALRKLGRIDHALSSNEAALKLNPSSTDIWIERGTLLIEATRYADAIGAYDRALSLDAASIDARAGRSNALRFLKRYDEALVVIDQIFALKPDSAEVFVGRGNVFFAMDRAADALECFDRAVSLDANSHHGWIGRGIALFAMNRDADALVSFDRALAIQPDHGDANYNKSLLSLSLGDYADGWRLYEHRPPLRALPSLRQPRWNGQPSDKATLIRSEQGIGDTIQFYRYLKLFTSGRVVFETYPALVRLFRYQGDNITVFAKGDPLPAFDAHVPLMSLPHQFGTRLDSIPAQIPYLVPDRAEAEAWRARLGETTKLRVGIAWSGNPGFDRDINRSIRLETILPLLSDGVEWFSLQKQVRDYDRAAVDATPSLRDVSGHLNDFSDTAALIERLDLVISVDTAVAHLAGAMGKPVWVLLPFHPDFRWMRDRTDSPWYPTATLFRQTEAGIWGDVLSRVSTRLRATEVDAEPVAQRLE